MAAPGGGIPAPSSTKSVEDAFRRLIHSQGKKSAPPEILKFIKKLDEIPEIALPEENPMKIAVALANRGLVGQFMGLWPSTKTTDDWIQRNWRPNLANGVTCYPVGRGYFVFEFISEEDRDLVFRNGPYFMGTQGLYLNKWTPDFNPLVDTPKEVPVWVRLPNLPMHCWDFESLQRIGNGVGRFIDKADNKGQYTCARICVEVDLEAGLPEAVKLTVGSWTHYQKLDYEHLPFKCRNCQEHGHFQRNCPKLQASGTEDAEGWQKVRRGKNSQNTKNRDKMHQEPSKEGNPKNNAQENPKTQENLTIVIEEGGNQQPGAPVSPSTGAKSISSSKEDTNLDTNTEAEIVEEEDTEASSPKGTPDQPKRGRKIEKKRREELSYKEVTQGTQHTIPDMMSTRQGSKQGKTPKGAPLPQASK
jgi:hypothetical protein